MKNALYFLALTLLFSCHKNDIARPVCYIQSEKINGVVHNYGYNDKNQLILDSYPGDNAVMGYDNQGNVVSETDAPDIQITYAYNNLNQLTEMNAVSASSPLAYNWQTKYNYNSNGQLIYIELWVYSSVTNSLYIDHYETLDYDNSGSKNYSVRKKFDPSGNLLSTMEYQWDTHPNPHLKNPYFSNEPPPANNITSIKYTFVGAHSSTSTYYSYVYNSNGFPIRQSVGGNIINTYTYTNCN